MKAGYYCISCDKRFRNMFTAWFHEILTGHVIGHHIPVFGIVYDRGNK